MSSITAEPDSGTQATGARIWRTPDDHLTPKAASRGPLLRTILMVTLLVVACILPLLLSSTVVFENPGSFLIYGFILAVSSMLLGKLLDSFQTRYAAVQLGIICSFLLVGAIFVLAGMVGSLRTSDANGMPPTEWLSEETAELTGSEGWKPTHIQE